jgi:UDP-N-acetylmuramoylalanine--D-glutamate ligase
MLRLDRRARRGDARSPHGLTVKQAPLVVDEWTPETAPHVVAARAAGRRVTCLANDVLVRSAVPVVGVTGTAGKTTTCALLVAMLRASGRPVACSQTARAGNLWPDEALLATVASLAPPAIVVVELTSTHLCYMDVSPAIAVVTNVWPDHGELHGSDQAYVAAKQRIVRFQDEEGLVLLPRDDSQARAFAGLGAGRVIMFDGDPAAAAARALDVSEDVIAGVLARGVDLPFRFRELGVRDGVRYIDDGMAATPRKVAAALERLAGERVVWIGGGHDDGTVHASEAETAALSRTCTAIVGAGWIPILYGRAAARLGEHVRGRSVATLADAVDVARATARPGDVIVHAPMFPVSMEERALFAATFTPPGDAAPPVP